MLAFHLHFTSCNKLNTVLIECYPHSLLQNKGYTQYFSILFHGYIARTLSWSDFNVLLKQNYACSQYLLDAKNKQKKTKYVLVHSVH
jgi:hypothetical protein